MPKTEDRLRRLTEENKKLIHLVTSLDQQVALLENKLTAGLAQGEEQRQRSRHSSNTGGQQNLFFKHHRDPVIQKLNPLPNMAIATQVLARRR